MEQTVNSELISIGTEILLGEITDTNSVYLARVLRDCGVNVFYMTSVGDNHRRIVDSLRLAMSRSQVVITCGGLGPTVDDMTRQAVAEAVGQALVYRADLIQQIEARFANFRVKMSENNKRQAYLPANALAIENAVGTAPAFITPYEGGIIISLPGVPRELKFLMQEKIVPYLRETFALGVIRARILHTAGIGESVLDEMIGVDLLEASNPTVGLAAHNGQVDVRITAKGEDEAAVTALIGQFEVQLRDKIGQWVYGVDSDTLEGALADALGHERRLAVVIAGLDDRLYAPLKRSLSDEALLSVRVYGEPKELSDSVEAWHGLGLRALSEAIARQSEGDAVIVVLCDPYTDESPDASERSAVSVRVGESARTRVYGFGSKSESIASWIRTWSLAQAWFMVKEANG